MGHGLEQRVQFSRDEDEDEEEEFLESDSFSSDSDDCEEDATPPSKASSLSVRLDPNEPLYELSSLMEQLPPIKKGLSRYYQGKSQSYTSLSVVSSLEDLPKKETPYRRRKMKTCKSYAGGLDAKNAPRVPSSCASLMSKSSSSGGLLHGSRRLPLQVQRTP